MYDNAEELCPSNEALLSYPRTATRVIHALCAVLDCFLDLACLSIINDFRGREVDIRWEGLTVWCSRKEAEGFMRLGLTRVEDNYSTKRRIDCATNKIEGLGEKSRFGGLALSMSGSILGLIHTYLLGITVIITCP